MEDIRINKLIIKRKTIELSFFKINFIFFSRILKKYQKNEYVDSLISHKIPLVFLTKSIDDESLLKSVSEILDMLSEQKDETKPKDEVDKKQEEQQKSEQLNKYYISNKNIHSNTDFKSPNLTYNYSSNDDKIFKTFESIINNIKKNLNINENTKTDSISVTEKIEKKEYEKSIAEKPKKQSKDKIKEKNKVISKKVIKNKESSPVKSDDKSKEEENYKSELNQKISTIDINQIKSQIEKINKTIIKKNIDKIRINKINYDFVSENRVLNQQIHKKVDKIVNLTFYKNNKFKKISDIYKDIDTFSKNIKRNRLNIQLKNLIEQSKSRKIISASSELFKYKRNSVLFDKSDFVFKKFKTKNFTDFVENFDSFLFNNHKFFDIYSEKINQTKKVIKKNKIKNISKTNLSSVQQNKIRKKISNNIDNINQVDKNFLFDKSDLIFNKFKTTQISNLTNDLNSIILNRDSLFKSYNNITDERTNYILFNKNKHTILDKLEQKVQKKKKNIHDFSVFSSNHDNILYKSRTDKYNLFSKFLHHFSKDFSNPIFAPKNEQSLVLNQKSISDFRKKVNKISKIENLYSKFIESKSKIFTKHNNDFIFKNQSKIHKNYIEPFENLIDIKNISKNLTYKEKSSVFRSENMIYRKKTDFKKIIEETVNKKINEQKAQNLPKKSLATTYYNENVKDLLKKSDTNLEKKDSGITKKEVSQMIESYINSINFRKISEKVAVQVSSCERTALELEREVEKIAKVDYMSDKAGMDFDGIISGITANGLYVELDNTVEGFVRYDTLTGFFIYDEKNYRAVNRGSGISLGLGDPVRIKVMAVDKVAKLIDFNIVQIKQ